ncbi:MAG: class I SAM-dependent RNA methyltransferase [Deltaproteobacteria bacterium]|nr:class I SAM-dependent RNA methyltransferase [Deltaproteobacteria bacterium]
MSFFTTPKPILIICNKRLSPYLEQEVINLGFTPESTFTTGVEIKGTLNDCIRLNLNLRCASQVLYLLKKFPATSPQEIYNTLLTFPWEKILPKDGYISITSAVDHATVNNSLFMNLKVKDAIADRMRGTTGKRPDSGPLLDHSVVHLFWKDEIAEIFIDTSGETLAKHGYRKMPGKAPMQEPLVAATLMATQWDKVSPFINPMCGSGTVAIEAALLATHRRPGLLRNNYGFMHWKGYDKAVYEQEQRKLKEQIKEVPDLLIQASDIHSEAVKTSQINAAAAGVEKYIQFTVGDFEITPLPDPLPEQRCVIFFNPEYGERLGKESELEDTYRRMGDFMKKKCKGYWGYIFTGNLDLAKKIGLRPHPRLEFYSAKMDCRLLQYELYAGTRDKKSE